MMPLYPSESVNNTIVNDLPQAIGSAGARNYPTRPNTRDAIWDKDENYIYVRVTDSANRITTLERLAYNQSPEPKPEDIFAKREDITELKGEISDVKQYIQELTNSIQSFINSDGSGNKDNGNGQSVKDERRRSNNPAG